MNSVIPASSVAQSQSGVIVMIVQAVSSTMAWLGLYVGIRALPDARARQSRWILGRAMVAAAGWINAPSDVAENSPSMFSTASTVPRDDAAAVRERL